MPCACAATYASCLQLVPRCIGLCDRPVIIAFRPLDRVLGFGKVVLVHRIANHEAEAVHQPDLISWICSMKMLCLEISIHHQGPGVQPGRSWQGILFFGIGIGIGTVQLHIDAHLRTCRTKEGQVAWSRAAIIVRKTMPFVQFALTPLPGHPHQLAVPVCSPALSGETRWRSFFSACCRSSSPKYRTPGCPAGSHPARRM